MNNNNNNVRLIRNLFSLTLLLAASSQPLLSVVNCDQNPNNQHAPCGNADIPANNLTNLHGAIDFGGWALSNISKVGIYRNPIGTEGSNFNGWVWIQDAVFIAGSRPDIANAYPAYPHNDWGYGTQVLSNMLPDSGGGSGHGNGTYTFHTVAFDIYGAWTNIGDATVGVNNAGSIKPFGTIDTPKDGGTASGQHYVNFGWALTPQPKIIYTNAQWIFVYVDNVLMPGNPVYNLSRCDIDIDFPNLRNSGSIDCMANGTPPGPVGFYTLDTTTLSNGLHTISWAVYDSDVVGEGLGSRYFYVSSQYFTLHAPATQTLTKGTSLNNIPVTYSAMNGFNSPVTLSGPSWPAGLSATFTPNPVTGQAMMTITSASNTLPGRYTLGLAGVSGSLNDSTSFSVTVNGSGSAINVDSTNGVSNASCLRDSVPCTPSFRWEPSSAAGTGWLTSWHDLGNYVPYGSSPNAPAAVKSFTSYWNGVWSAPFEHRTHSTDSQFNNHALQDTYLYWDTSRSQFELVAVDFDTVCNSVWFHSSNDSAGATWNDMVLIPPLTCTGVPYKTWDFPSMAVDPNTGRIVAGASQITGTDPMQNTGYYTAYSTDGGATWNGGSTIPYLVNGSPTGGATSRIVWSASGFHAFINDCSNPMNCLLRHWQSPDGQTWTPKDPVGGAYVMPLTNSPNAFTCGSSGCGHLFYAPVPDAASSPGSALGWVVAYPVNNGGLNAINVVTELGGANTIIDTVDLFGVGITTSSSGDYYLTYQRNQDGAPGLIEEGVVYRPPGPQPTFKGRFIQTNIDPGQWQSFLDHKRCVSVDNPTCFASGDFFRPAMNQYTGATVPMIVQPSLVNDPASLVNDLVQSFIDDPPGVSEYLPRIEPYLVGTSLTSRGVMTPTHVKQVAMGQHLFWASTMVYESLRRSGVIK